MISKNDAIRLLVSGNLSFKANGSINYMDGQTPPSEEEINAKFQELKTAYPMKLLREQRNRKLAETDWMANSDVTMTDEWRTYRQALRDLSSTASPELDEQGNLTNVSWPTKPE